MNVAAAGHPEADDELSTALPDAVLRPVREGNAFEATVEQLATSVRLGVFARGERLPPERELAERLGVSRTTLREAIGALRQAGMVQTHRGRGGGTVVTYQGEARQPLRRTGAELHDALDFRAVVEPGAAALAATRDLTAQQRAWLVQCRVKVEQSRDVATHRVADSRLHLAIVTLSGSELLVGAVTQVQSLVHELLTAIPVLGPNIAHSNAQHRQVVDAVLAGDPDGARAAMEEHCSATSALLRGLLG
ncbi:MAG TPA: FCD domain-containing protein [Actinomycetales bacterium]|nr:FCD domain-containing protein [Actinomycetales bacterium]